MAAWVFLKALSAFSLANADAQSAYIPPGVFEISKLSMEIDSRKSSIPGGWSSTPFIRGTPQIDWHLRGVTRGAWELWRRAWGRRR
eukprot:6250135-Pyramimonas_sp.AAC.1